MSGSRRILVLLGCWALVHPATGAEAVDAPLADSKKALEELRKNQANDAVAPSPGKLHDFLPPIVAPGALPGPLEPAGPPKSDKALKKDRQKNWLVDGVGQLDKKKDAPTKNGRRDLPVTTEEDDPDGSADPDSLLSLYSEQRSADEKAAEAAQKRAALADQTAPLLLQGWLANSPVRENLLGDTIRKPELGGTASGGGVAGAGRMENLTASPGLADSPNRGLAAPGASAAPAASTNPYLQALDLAALSSHAALPEATLKTGPAPASSSPLPSLLPAPMPERKPPPAPSQDDKKHFPQLKKF